MLLVSSSEDDLSSSSDEGSEGGNPGVQDIIKWTLSDSEEDDTGSEQHCEPRDSVLPIGRPQAWNGLLQIQD